MTICLTGDNDAARSQVLRELVTEFAAKHGDMAVERLDGEEASYERMNEAGQSVPFLSERKLLVLRTPGANKEFAEKLETFVDSISESVDVILVEPKLDKRLSYYKQLKKLTDFREFSTLDVSGLVSFAVDYATEHGGTLTYADARLLVERTGATQLALRHELDKLLAYNLTITRKSIELLTEQTPQSSIFELIDAAFSGDTSKTMRLYDEQRAQQVEPQQVIAMLAWQLHILALVKVAKERSVDDIAREAKLNPFVVRKSQGLARHITLAQLKQLIAELREFDVRTKSEGIVPDEAVRFFLLKLASPHSVTA